MAHFTRRSIVVGTAMSSLLVGARALARPAMTGADTVVELQQGTIRGGRVRNMRTFKAIPFASPPIGPNRFKPPQPAPKWQGIRDGSAFAAAPLQPKPGYGRTVEQALGTPVMSEDCLYLNVFAPSSPGPHPVYVWVHGGGNETGAASQAPFDSGSFVENGIVCVTVAYRVGMLGFLELGGLLGEAYRGSGNNGLKDVVAALHWVQRNIRAFGGDPNQVTIGGESAGAKNAVALLASPAARGLFLRAIVESGGETVHDVSAADAVAATVARSLKARGQDAQALLTAPPALLLQLQAELRAAVDRPFPFRALIDGDFLPSSPHEVFDQGKASHVPLLIGTNRDEAVMFLDPKLVDQPLSQSECANYDVEAARPVFDRYRRAYPELSAKALRVRFLTAEEYWLSSVRLAKAHAAHRNAATFLYRFERPASSGPFAGWAMHAAELGYTWNRLDGGMSRALGQAPDARNQALADTMHARWSAFILTGQPGTGAQTPWPRLTAAGDMLVFADGERRGDVDAAELGLWSA